MSNIRIPNYSVTEEIINSISHGFGALLSIIGFIFLITRSFSYEKTVFIFSSILYGVSLIILYTISCIYHGLSSKLKAKKVLRVIDHCNVYLFIAATYTPICLISLNGMSAWIIFLLVWVVTILGIIFTCINIDKYQISSVICHLAAGWIILLVLKSLILSIGNIGAILLLTGGIFYSLGSILYVIGRKTPYMHCIFHFFVLVGSILHFITIYCYVI